MPQDQQPQPRKCEYCKKGVGVFSYRYITPEKEWTQGYFHTACFPRFLKKLHHITPTRGKGGTNAPES